MKDKDYSTVSLAELVTIRDTEEKCIIALKNQISVRRKRIKEMTKQINANLASMVIENTKEEISPTNFGYHLVQSVSQKE